MADLNDINSQLNVFCEKVQQLKQIKTGNYSAKFEIPVWQNENKDFITQVSASVGKFSGHMNLLQNSDVLAQDINKQILEKLSKKISQHVEFYQQQWGAKHDNDFCKQLLDGLQKASAEISAYSKPTPPRPSR
jgi:hypothetical protein